MYNFTWVSSIILGLLIYYFVNLPKLSPIIHKFFLPLIIILLLHIILDYLLSFNEGFSSGNDDEVEDNNEEVIVEEGIIEGIKDKKSLIEGIKGGGGSSKSGAKSGAKSSGSKMMNIKASNKSKRNKNGILEIDEQPDIPDIKSVAEPDDTPTSNNKTDKIENKQLKVLKDIDKTLKNKNTVKDSIKETVKESFDDYAPYNNSDIIGATLDCDCLLDNCSLCSTEQNRNTYKNVPIPGPTWQPQTAAAVQRRLVNKQYTSAKCY